MTRGQGATKADGVARWLLPASVLHAAVILLVAALSPGSTPTAERAAPLPSVLEEQESNVELTLLEGDEWSRLARSEPASVAPVESGAARERPSATDGHRDRHSAARCRPGRQAFTARGDRALRGRRYREHATRPRT